MSPTPSSPLQDVLALDLVLRAQDTFPLAARLWAAPGSSTAQYAALINSGAGISSRYYDRFAAFLARNGIPTLVYDYRGVGRSRPHSLRGFHASVEEWGSKDCAAALEWLRVRYPGAKRMVIGHSIGGFVTGFVTNGALIDRMLLIGAHTGYWRDYSARARPLMFLLWHVLMPCVATIVGFFPGKRLHLLEDLPRGVALEWAARLRPEFWWNLRRDDGSPDTVRIENLLARFATVRAPALAIRFTDDPFATEEATARILGLYPNISAVRLVFDASDGDGRAIGHFGFFDSRFRSTLWQKVLDSLSALPS